MTRNKNPHFCAPNNNSSTARRFNRINSCKNLFKIGMFAVLAPLCLLIFVSSAVAESKTKHSRAKTDTRSRRVAVNNRTSSKRKIADKKRVASKSSASDKRRSNVKLASKQVKRRTRDRVYVRETAKLRETASSQVTTSNVRKTAIVTPKLPNNVNVTRPTLVNDIVIISEAPESVASRVSSTTTRGTGSSANMPSIWPVAGAIRGGFGVRHNPFGGPGSEFHKGQDISAPYGSQVIATADGVVVISGWLRGYGQVVYVDHGNGISTRYGHLSRIDVVVGQTIKRGDQLGLVGSTGRSTGPHLHYEVRIDGQATNPIPYLPNIPVQPMLSSPANR